MTLWSRYNSKPPHVEWTLKKQFRTVAFQLTDRNPSTKAAVSISTSLGEAEVNDAYLGHYSTTSTSYAITVPHRMTSGNERWI